MIFWNALKTVLQTMLRLVGFPTKTGLRVLGQPGPGAPVLVTCNYDLTVRRVIKALRGVDCYLLVAPSKGINVWCAAGGGHFNAHSVISVVKTSDIASKVDHRKLILPQLAAPGVDPARIEDETGWHCRFGPIYAEDLPEYLAQKQHKTPAMRQVRFPLGHRLEMAVMWASTLSVIGLVALFFSLHVAFGLWAITWGLALVLFLFYRPLMRYLPGPAGMFKTFVLGLFGCAGLVAWSLFGGHWSGGTLLAWSLALLGISLVLGFDLEGTSPLTAGSTVAYWGRKWPSVYKAWRAFGYDLEEFFTLHVETERCNGCKTCQEVCPKDVFDLEGHNGHQRSHVARLDDCVQCTACVKQCPEEAIEAHPPIRLFSSTTES